MALQGSQVAWSVNAIIATGTGTTALLASPGAGRKIFVQEMNWIVTTTAAQTFVFGDGTTVLFQSVASQPVGWYGLDFGEPGIPLLAATALSFTPSAAGYSMSISMYGYYGESAT